MKSAPHGTLFEFYPAPAERAGFVSDLFDRAAGDYDWMSGAMSFGTDRAYRRRVLKAAGLKPGMRVLDVATGTGLVARAALELGITAGQLIGLDSSRGMLAENRKRHAIPLIQGMGEIVPFRAETFDFVVMGYALRHVEDLDRLFGEFHRVLRNPGRVLILEITRPSSRLGLGLMQFYMQRLLPFLTRMGAGFKLAQRRIRAGILSEYFAVKE